MQWLSAEPQVYHVLGCEVGSPSPSTCINYSVLRVKYHEGLNAMGRVKCHEVSTCTNHSVLRVKCHEGLNAMKCPPVQITVC